MQQISVFFDLAVIPTDLLAVLSAGLSGPGSQKECPCFARSFRAVIAGEQSRRTFNSPGTGFFALEIGENETPAVERGIAVAESSLRKLEAIFVEGLEDQEFAAQSEELAMRSQKLGIGANLLGAVREAVERAKGQVN